MTALEMVVAAGALLRQKEHEYDAAVDELAKLHLKCIGLREHYESLLDLAGQAAQRLIDSGEMQSMNEARVEMEEYQAGIKKIRAARLRREAAAAAAVVGQKPMTDERAERKAA